MHSFLVILYKRAGSNFLPENQVTSLLKTAVVHVSEKTKIHYANDKPSRIIGRIKHTFMSIE